MFDEISKSIKATLYERVSSPLTGSFIISWIIINWKVVLSIFSSLPVQSKIEFIESLYPTWWNYALYGLVIPLIASTIFILIYPHPTKWLYKYWHEKKIELRNEKLKLDSVQLLSEKESRELHEKINNQQNAFNEVLKIRDNEIKDLKEKLEPKAIDIPTKPTDRRINEDPLTKDETVILKCIFKAYEQGDYTNTFNEIFNETDFGRTKTLGLIESLETKEMIIDDNKHLLNTTTKEYTLTPKGRQYAIEKDWAN